jgi:dTDP-3-amino-3,4,6-trideoxy-alpha-D-glucose transaminase
MIAIPQAAPALRIARYRAEIDEAIAEVLGAGRYILGPRVEQFEEAFSAYIGAAQCISVNWGTDALALSLRALGIGPGDEVITTALTAAGTTQAILQCGAQPCLVDVDPVTRCIDPRAVEAAINARTAVIVPVHLFGQPANMLELLRIASRHNLAVVEDCAQAHGATIHARKVGTFGNAAAFSFYPTKNLGCIGDGGAIVTNDALLASKLRTMRCYGWSSGKRISDSLGFNSRLDELQAAILTVLLRYLDEGNCERQALAAKYRRLEGLGFDLPPEDPGAVYHQFAIACDERDALRTHLSDIAGIQTAVHYYPALHQQPAFQAAAPIRLPETERLARRLLSLPIQPEVAVPHLKRIIEATEGGIRRCRGS